MAEVFEIDGVLYMPPANSVSTFKLTDQMMKATNSSCIHGTDYIQFKGVGGDRIFKKDLVDILLKEGYTTFKPTKIKVN